MSGEWNVWHVLVSFLGGATAFGFAAYMISTFPVPNNKYARWLLGGCQWLISQQERSKNTLNNHDTVTVATPKKEDVQV